MSNMIERQAFGSGIAVITAPDGRIFAAEAAEFTHEESTEVVAVKGNSNYAKEPRKGPKKTSGKFKLTAWDKDLFAAMNGGSATGSVAIEAEYTAASAAFVVPTGSGIVSALTARNANGQTLQFTTGSAVAGQSFTLTIANGSGSVHASEALPVTVVYTQSSGTGAYTERERPMGERWDFDLAFYTYQSDTQHGIVYSRVAMPKVAEAFKAGEITSTDIDFEAFPDASGIVFTRF